MGPQIVHPYEYGDFGQLIHVIDAADHVSTIEYSKIGRRVAFTDPDRGLVGFGYDRFDEAEREWDAIHDIRYVHDVLGRVVQKQDTHGSPTVTEQTTFQYDEGVGAAMGRLTQATSPDDVLGNFAYDKVGRPTKTSWTVEDEVFEVEQTYSEELGRPERTLYPEVPGQARFHVDVGYNSAGHANTLSTEPAPALPLWRVMARNPQGLLEQARWQGARVETRHYDANTGRLEAVRVDHATANGPAPLYNVLYEYQQGELSKRTDAVMKQIRPWLRRAGSAEDIHSARFDEPSSGLRLRQTWGT